MEADPSVGKREPHSYLSLPICISLSVHPWVAALPTEGSPLPLYPLCLTCYKDLQLLLCQPCPFAHTYAWFPSQHLPNIAQRSLVAANSMFLLVLVFSDGTNVCTQVATPSALRTLLGVFEMVSLYYPGWP